ncbi:MAG: PEP-CTERM sorting domain-containing protein [Verrucomicrobiota bacterium]
MELLALSQNPSPGIAYWEVDRVRLTSVPEPATGLLALAGSSVLALAWARRRRTH